MTFQCRRGLPTVYDVEGDRMAGDWIAALDRCFGLRIPRGLRRPRRSSWSRAEALAAQVALSREFLTG